MKLGRKIDNWVEKHGVLTGIIVSVAGLLLLKYFGII